jgi:hypothetical protein
MAEVKISELPIANSLSSSDRLVFLANPGSNPSVRTITTLNFSNTIISNTAPANSSSSGTAGQLAYDSEYLYVCIANNTWGRVSLTLSW